uniref:Flavodoxin family protein n=1 Tax=Ignisphaera aggregans TaxID=334771 RepID=A0A7C4FCY2_9CREN
MQTAVLHIAEELRRGGVEVKVFLVKPVKDYYPKLLHLNPRLIHETITGKSIEVTGLEHFDPNLCRALVVATPIWFGRPSPPITTFIKMFANKVKCPVYALATSIMSKDYAARLRKLLEEMGYSVRGCASLARGVSYSELRRLLEDIGRSIEKA